MMYKNKYYNARDLRLTKLGSCGNQSVVSIHFPLRRVLKLYKRTGKQNRGSYRFTLLLFRTHWLNDATTTTTITTILLILYIALAGL